VEDWWKSLLDSRKTQGRENAGDGYFESPYPGSNDPQDEAENAAYEQGFNEERRKLGSDFVWR